MTERPPRVSVVIPVYNRVSLLPRAVASVLAQTFADFELVVVDDGSREDVAGALRAFDDPRLRIIRHAKNLGMGSARNTGIEAARGEWIANLDSDDEWRPAYLERQMARLDAGPAADIAGCLCERRYRDESVIKPKGLLPEGDEDAIAAFMEHRRAATPSAYVMRRSALLAAGGYDTVQPAADDFDLLLKLAVAGCRFAAVQEPLVIKHDHDLGQARTDPVARLEGTLLLERRWRGEMDRHASARDARRYWRRRWRRVRRTHEKFLERLAAGGSRREALRYAWRMRRHARWGRRFVARALAFALLGRGVYAMFGLARTPEAGLARNAR